MASERPSRKGSRRGHARLRILACAGCSLAAFGARGQDQADPRRFSITPTLRLEEILTDNATVTDQNRKTDLVTRGGLTIDARLNSGRATGNLTTEVFYDQYASSTELSGASLTATGSGAFAVVPNLLSFEADGAVVNGRPSTFGASAVDRAGVRDRTQLFTYQVGPRLTARLGDFADLTGAARFSQVIYSRADASPFDVVLPADDSIVQLVGDVDTANRFLNQQFVTSVRFERDDQGFRSASAVQSAYFNVRPRLRVIARGGYDNVYQQGVIDISSPLLSTGLEYTLNPASKISIEGGQRYNRGSWAAKAEVTVLARLALTASYNEVIQPDQVLVANAFQRFVDDAATLPAPLVSNRFTPTGGFYQQTSLNKIFVLGAVYQKDRQSFEVSTYSIDREFLPTRVHDRTLTVNASYKRQLRPDLSLTIRGDYEQTFDSPVYGPSRTYGLQSRLAYQVNSTTSFDATYAFSRSSRANGIGQSVFDNTLLIAVRKRI